MENIVEIRIDDSFHNANKLFIKVQNLFKNSEFEVSFLTKDNESMSGIKAEHYYVEIKKTK